MLAFLAIYVVWGSTYLAIRFAVETLPPFLMAGVRFTVAGVVMWGVGRLRGLAAPGLHDLKVAVISGVLMLVGGNGAVVWAEQWMASGTASLLVAVVPMWMVLLDWATGGTRPGWRILSGLGLGFGGVALLFGAPEIGTRAEAMGGVAILFGTLSWAVGSLYVRGSVMTTSGTMAVAAQMLGGGVAFLLVGLLAGEAAITDLSRVSVRSWISLAWLIVAGSIVAYTAYLWLLRRSTVARVSTYAYVNPVVAVILGAGFAGEKITPEGALAALVIVLAVALVLTGSSRPGPRAVTPLESTS